MINLYVVLGVPPGSSTENIKARYRELARLKHPDLGGDTDEFAAITEAGAVLTDEGDRSAHDRALRLFMDPCVKCAGAGLRYIQLTFTQTVTRRCELCKGEGFHARPTR